MKKHFLLGMLLCLASQAYAQAPLIAKVEISGNSTIPHDALEQNLDAQGLIVGEPFNNERLEVLAQHLRDHYRYTRRSEAEVETHIEPLDNGEVNIEIRIHEITAEEGLPEGYNNDPYSDDLYREIRVSDDPTISDQTAADEMDDDRIGTVSLGLGYGNKGVNYRLSLIKRELFGNKDLSMRLTGMHDRYESNIDLGISKANFFHEKLRLDTNLFYDAFDNSRSKTAAPYHRRSYGIQATINIPESRYSGYYAGFRYTHNQIKDLRPEYHRAIYLNSLEKDDWRFNARDVDLVLGWQFNNYNRKLLPTRGLGIKLDGSISLPGSDNKYYKLKLDGQGYYPLNRAETWLISAKTTLGYAQGMHNQEVPFYQNFTAGGADTLRGFAYGTVGPRAVYSAYNLQRPYNLWPLYQEKSQQTIGGNALAAASLELVVPSVFIPESYRSNFRTALFVDAASVWETGKNLRHPLGVDNNRSRNIRVSAGIALQWQFPVGVLSVSYAVPIKKYQGDRTEALQINIGSSF